MAQSNRENALVQMHCHMLSIGVSVTADAGMFTVPELIQLIRAADASGFRTRVTILSSKSLGAGDRARILACTTEHWRIVFR